MKLIPALLSALVLFQISCKNSSVAEKPEKGEDVLIFKDSAGHTLSQTDLENFTGTASYEITDMKNIDPKAKQLHNEARVLGQTGKYDEAIKKLTEAISIQPEWAYPPYDLAYTYLLKGDNEKALEYYTKTNALEPKGFFTTKTAVYALEGEKSGKFPKGTYLGYLSLEWAEDVNHKLEIALAISEKVPTFAPVWKDLANLADDTDARKKAIEKGLACNPDLETKGILLINKALILKMEGKKEEATQLLGNLIFSPESSTSNIELAKFTLKSFVER